MEHINIMIVEDDESLSCELQKFLYRWNYTVAVATTFENIVDDFNGNQRIIAGNAQFAGIAAGRGVRFTTGLLLLGKGLGMRETPIRPHSWH